MNRTHRQTVDRRVLIAIAALAILLATTIISWPYFSRPNGIPVANSGAQVETGEDSVRPLTPTVHNYRFIP